MLCPYCSKEELILIPEDYPWSTEHLYCPSCDSTYNMDENGKPITQ